MNAQLFARIQLTMERYFVKQQNNTSVTIGGVRTLTDFSPEQMVVSVSGAKVIVTGEKLRIARFDENEIIISGKIIEVKNEK